MPAVQPPLSTPLGCVVPDPPDPDDYYPYEDGIRFAFSPEQGRVMMDVRQALENYLGEWPGVYIGMDMLVYDKQGDRTSRLAPDVFVTFDVEEEVGRSYRIWEVGKPPDVVWEFGSETSPKGDAKEKKERYRGWGVSEYWLYDPHGELHNPRLQGFRLVEGRYRPLPPEYRSDALLVVKSPLLGLDLHFDGRRLRLWDPVAGDYMRTGGESERELLKMRAISLEERAGTLTERDRELMERNIMLRDRYRRLRERTVWREERTKRLEAEARAEAEARVRREAEDRARAAEDRLAEVQNLVAELPASNPVPSKQP